MTAGHLQGDKQCWKEGPSPAEGAAGMSPLRSFSRSQRVFRCWHLVSTSLVLPGARAQVGAATEPHGVPVSPPQPPPAEPRGLGARLESRQTPASIRAGSGSAAG